MDRRASFRLTPQRSLRRFNYRKLDSAVMSLRLLSLSARLVSNNVRESVASSNIRRRWKCSPRARDEHSNYKVGWRGCVLNSATPKHPGAILRTILMIFSHEEVVALKIWTFKSYVGPLASDDNPS